MRKLCMLACLGCLLWVVFAGQAMAQTYKMGNVLVVYYSNRGSTQLAAEAIKVRTGADIYAIKPLEDYDSATISEVVKNQYAKGELPDLADFGMIDFSKYDLIFLGAPVWWGNVPPPMQTYLSRENFLGVPVALFSTSNGTPAAFFNHFTQLVNNGDVISAKDFGMARNLSLVIEVETWLDAIKAQMAPLEPLLLP